jgi:hypothetical protein
LHTPPKSTLRPHFEVIHPSIITVAADLLSLEVLALDQWTSTKTAAVTVMGWLKSEVANSHSFGQPFGNDVFCRTGGLMAKQALLSPDEWNSHKVTIAQFKRFRTSKRFDASRRTAGNGV